MFLLNTLEQIWNFNNRYNYNVHGRVDLWAVHHMLSRIPNIEILFFFRIKKCKIIKHTIKIM